MLRDAGVRTKLLAVLAIPTLLLVVVTSLLVGGQVTAARRAGQVHAITDVAVQVNRVVHSLQEERSATLSYLQDPSSGAEARMTGQRRFTNQQLHTLRQLVADSPVAQMSEAVQAAVARSSAGHEELLGARRSIDAGRFFTTETDVFYSKTIRTDLDLPGVIASSGTSALAQRLQAYEAVSTAIEYASHERDLVETALLRGTVTEADFAQSAALVSQQRAALADFQRNAGAATYSELEDALATSQNAEIDKVRRGLTDLLQGREPDYGKAVEWVGSANSRIGPMTDTESGVVIDIAAVAADVQGSQEQRALILVVASFLGLGLALMLAVGLARRITRPLRRLTVAAGEIGDELPRMVERMQTPGDGPGVVVEPIPVESSDEIGRLAEAFNTVNDVTVQVAKEQAALRSSIAEMFVNVARRNQVLLGRQLSQLDTMEAREEDPDVLDNLFKLDHLATRMRRNAESLLVLAGIDSTRRLRRPLPLSDVIRTAVGEIESFDRIDLSMSEDPDVSGRHALTVAHLLAELLENATHFSNPETRVVVSASVTGHGVDLTVTDYGLGMSDEEVVEANEKIAHPPVAEIAVSQRLGLFVVGRLASRLGASVVLRRGRAAGLVVAVALPTSVFEGMAVPEPVEDEAAAPVFDAADTDAAPRIILGPADDALEVVNEPDPEPTPEPVVPAPAPALLSAGSVPASALAQGEALVPETAFAETAPLPSRRSLATPGSADLLTDDAADALAAPVPTPPVAESVLRADEDAAARRPERPAGRGLFARWSRTPAEGAPLDGPAEDHPIDAEVAEADVTESVEVDADADAPAVEMLAVETPADELSVELEVEMVAIPDVEDVQDVAVEDVAVEDVAVEDVAVEDVAVEDVADAPVAAVESPAVPKRRGLFSRWSRRPTVEEPPADEPVAAQDAAVVDEVEVDEVVARETVAEPAVASTELTTEDGSAVEDGTAVDDVAEPVAEVEVAEPVAEVEREPWPVAEVEPEPLPEPVRPPVVYAKAVDILPSQSARGGGMFGRHRKHAAATPAPAAPAPAQAVAEPVEQPPVAALPAEPVALLPVEPVEVPSAEVPPIGVPLVAEATPVTEAPAVADRVPADEPVQPAQPAAAQPVVPAPRDLTEALFDAPSVAAVTPGVDGPPLQAPAVPVAPLAPRRPTTPVPDVAGSLPSRTPSSEVEPVGPAPSADLDRMAARAELHQSALSELRGLYEPSFAPPAPAVPVPTETGSLTRRTPKAAVDAGPPPPPAARTRTAAEVRGMLSGFRAGVERGRGSAPADAPSDAIADSGTPNR